MGIFGNFFAKFSATRATPADVAEFRRVLLEADLGPSIVNELIVIAQGTKSEDFASAITGALAKNFTEKSRDLIRNSSGLTTILIVGVNGTGKTTSAAKLAKYLQGQGALVLLGAADTFRAAAVDQLTTWGERIGVEVVTGNESADPAAVAFDSARRAIEIGADYLIIDTAGRLHTKNNLMAELTKVKRVIEKVTPVHDVLYVLDGSTGQNGLTQVKIFTAAVGVTGLIVTKLDGSAKGGIALTSEGECDIPIKFIGRGEAAADFALFDAPAYLADLIGG